MSYNKLLKGKEEEDEEEEEELQSLPLLSYKEVVKEVCESINTPSVPGSWHNHPRNQRDNFTSSSSTETLQIHVIKKDQEKTHHNDYRTLPHPTHD